MKELYKFVGAIVITFLIGIYLGGQTKVKKVNTNKVMRVVDNPNCISGRML